ncbi:MAG TPA: hypothetical protein VGD39_08540 [Nocardioides sp.]
MTRTTTHDVWLGPRWRDPQVFALRVDEGESTRLVSRCATGERVA